MIWTDVKRRFWLVEDNKDKPPEHTLLITVIISKKKSSSKAFHEGASMVLQNDKVNQCSQRDAIESERNQLDAVDQMQEKANSQPSE